MEQDDSNRHRREVVAAIRYRVAMTEAKLLHVRRVLEENGPGEDLEVAIVAAMSELTEAEKANHWDLWPLAIDPGAAPRITPEPPHAPTRRVRPPDTGDRPVQSNLVPHEAP